ncbi:MAG: nuclear transport factor 2 family protein [Ginsengibacter sp.]
MHIFLRKGFLLMFISAVIFVSCDEQDKIAIEKSASVFDIEQGKASIHQSNLRFMNAFKEKDSVEVANCFTKNGIIMIDGFPSIEGRDAIKHFFSQVMANGVKKYELETKNIWGDSSILVEEGVYKLTGKVKKEVGKGKYIVLWKQESGNWKMFRDIWARDFPSTALIPGGDSAVVEIKKKALHFF